MQFQVTAESPSRPAAGRSRPVGARWIGGRGTTAGREAHMSRYEAVPEHDLGGVPTDLPDLLGRLARRDPDADAVLDRAADGTRTAVSRGALWRRTRALAARLAADGIGPGDCVAVWLPNWSD